MSRPPDPREGYLPEQQGDPMSDPPPPFDTESRVEHTDVDIRRLEELGHGQTLRPGGRRQSAEEDGRDREEGARRGGRRRGGRRRGGRRRGGRRRGGRGVRCPGRPCCRRRAPAPKRTSSHPRGRDRGQARGVRSWRRRGGASCAANRSRQAACPLLIAAGAVQCGPGAAGRYRFAPNSRLAGPSAGKT